MDNLRLEIQDHGSFTDWVWKDEGGGQVLFVQKGGQEEGEEEYITLEWKKKDSFSLQDFLEVVNAFAEKHGSSQIGGIFHAEDFPSEDPWFEFEATLPITLQDFEEHTELQKIVWVKIGCVPPGVSFWFGSGMMFSGNNLEEVTSDDVRSLVERSSGIDPSWFISTVRETVSAA